MAQNPGVPEPTPPPLADDEGAEVSLGQSGRARAANEAVRALARASRSYTIYDPQNEAIRSFLTDVKNRMELLLEAGDCRLEVRPYELVLDGEVVYLDRDRERSLAFKLFRDGVRRVNLEQGLTWHEVTQLLGVLSMRYVGIHQNPAEDDMVTLLWKAGFQHIQVEAVEGFLPEDEAQDRSAAAAAVSASQVQRGEDASLRFPHDFDLPAPTLPAPEAPTWAPLDPEQTAALLSADDSTRIADQVVDLVRELLRAALDPTDPLSLDELIPAVRDVRGLMLTEEHVPAMLRLCEALERGVTALDEEQGRPLRELLDSFLGVGALTQVVRAIGQDEQRPSPALLRLLDNARCDPLLTCLDLMEQERGLAQRRVLRQVIEGYLPARVQEVLARYRERRGSVAADLLRALVNAAPQQASEVIAHVASGDDIELQLEFLTLARHNPMGSQARSLLVHLLHAPSEEVRVRALDIIVALGEAGAFLPVVRHAEARVKSGASEAELEAVGQALAGLSTERALAQFQQWCTGGGFLSRWIKTEQPLRRVSAAGLALIPGDDAERLLQSLVDQGAEADARAARKAMTQRKHHANLKAREAALAALERYRQQRGGAA